MIVAQLAWQSLRNRAATAVLTVLAIALSTMLLLGVEKIRTGARQSFADTISGTDLVVGARSGALQLLLYSVFRIGNATNNVSWATYAELAAAPEVDWIVPLSLGDSHRGFRVLGTSTGYFQHYKYRRGQSLTFASGTAFADLYDVVIGSEVAARLGYGLNDTVVIAHGTGSVAFVEHGDKPFRVAGILARTGTPVDRTILVSLEAVEAIHADWKSGIPAQGAKVSAERARQLDLAPKAITAAMLGLKSKTAIFKVQRRINEYQAEPLSAIIPGAALQELWGLIGTAETALSAVSIMVVATALIGMVTSILATLNERRREMAILRSVGASARTILTLLTAEAVMLTAAGALLGVVLLYLGLAVLGPMIDRMYGLTIVIGAPTATEFGMLGLILVAGLLAGFLPALRAYTLSVADGMTIRT